MPRGKLKNILCILMHLKFFFLDSVESHKSGIENVVIGQSPGERGHHPSYLTEATHHCCDCIFPFQSLALKAASRDFLSSGSL